MSQTIVTGKSKTHLVIPDSHAHPGHPNKRYDVLAKLIIDLKPDVVVDIGDWFDMPSLSSYDKGTRSFEGKRYWKDIEAGVEAQDRIYSRLAARKKKMPKFIRTLGNHEHRIERAIEKDPSILDGVISTDDLLSKEYGWEEFPFRAVANVDGVNYSHYFVSGVLGRPVSSARALLNKQYSSCTMGHAHSFDYFNHTNVEGQRFHGLICGVYQDYNPTFAEGSTHLWRRGVCIKHNVSGGDYDLEWVSMKRLFDLYGRS